jgi:DNA invertase Pin-like site-specific DNA recombinase
MSVKAYSYLRFSTPEQAKGDSMRRQTALADQYAALHGLELDAALTFRDLGISAFRGNNARTGALGAFLRAIDDGFVSEGSYLLVESLDRVSRQDPWDALPVFQQIINAGVTIVSLQDNKAYSQADFRQNPIRLLESLFVMIRANEESETKAKRLRAAWVGKRQRVSERPLTRICPAWLELDKAAGRFVVNEGRAEVVRRIFRLATEGVGLHGIAQGLNDDAVPTFGHLGRRAHFWHRSYVAKIAANAAVIGTLTPHIMVHTGGTKRRLPQDPVHSYFPAVVSEEAFEAVQAQRLGPHIARNRTGASQVASLVAGLAECPVCGTTMTRVSKGPRGGKPRLVCVRARAKLCSGRSVVLEDVERALETSSEQITGTAPVGGQELQDELDRLENLVDVVSELGADAEADWRASRSPAARERLTRLEAEMDGLRAGVKDAENRRAAAGPGLLLRLAEFRVAIAARPMDRPQVNALLRSFLSAIVVEPADGTLTLRWIAGGETTVHYAW